MLIFEQLLFFYFYTLVYLYFSVFVQYWYVQNPQTEFYVRFLIQSLWLRTSWYYFDSKEIHSNHCQSFSTTVVHIIKNFP